MKYYIIILIQFLAFTTKSQTYKFEKIGAINVKMHYWQPVLNQVLYIYEEDFQTNFPFDSSVAIIANEFKVVPLFRYDFTYNGLPMSIIKFEKLTNREVLTNLYLKNKEIKLIDSSIIGNMFFVFKYIKKAFIYRLPLYNEEKNELYPIIKPYINENNSINLDKLGAYLRTKPKEMEKYCDF